MLGLYRDNRKENGSYYTILGLYRVMETKLETTIVYWGYIGIMDKNRNYYSIAGVCRICV